MARGPRPDAQAPQPDLPDAQVRLLAVRAQDDSVVVEVEGGRAYVLAPASLPPGLPAPGGLLDGAQHRAVALAAARKAAARRLFLLLDRRLQPVARLRRKLLEAGYPAEAVDAVLAAMEEQGLHSDRRYAEAYCRDCLLSRAVGRGYLVAKLRERGVAPAVAGAAAVAALDDDTERELALQAARARWRKLGGARGPQALAKVVRHLLGRGFAPGVAQRAARRTQDEDGAA